MKKVLSVILAAMLIIAAVPVAAEEVDPIVGIWYLDYEVWDGLDSLVGVFDRYLNLYIFDEHGNVMTAMFFFDNGYDDKSSMQPINVGTWQKVQDHIYTINTTMTVGRSFTLLMEDSLFLPTASEGYYIYHPLQHFSLYSNYMSDMYVDSMIKFLMDQR